MRVVASWTGFFNVVKNGTTQEVNMTFVVSLMRLYWNNLACETGLLCFLKHHVIFMSFTRALLAFILLILTPVQSAVKPRLQPPALLAVKPKLILLCNWGISLFIPKETWSSCFSSELNKQYKGAPTPILPHQVDWYPGFPHFMTEAFPVWWSVISGWGHLKWFSFH